MTVIRALRTILLTCLLAVPGALSAQYYDWGRSPQGIRWIQSKGAHGKVIYPDYFSKNAARVLSCFDTIHHSVGYGFKYPPVNFPIVLHTENFQDNGLVIWAPKRIELELIPPAAPFAEPWYKQLISHEYRHAVVYANLYRGFMKGIGWILGQQAGLVSSVLVPLWFLEGDAVMTETQMTTFGRGLQPSFTIEMRAYLTEGKQKFPLDKWFCGSFKNYMPDHYQFGYQVTSWSRERYGDSMWSPVAEYSAKYPYTILTSMWAIRKYYHTSMDRMAHETLDDLKHLWQSQPVTPNSAKIIHSPVTSYTVYSAPMRLNDTTLLAVKRDMKRTNQIVAVDLRTHKEHKVAGIGLVNTPPELYDGKLYWTEYRYSTLWAQRVLSKVCTYDMATGRREVLRDRPNALYPTRLPDGRVLTVHYDYKGAYSLEDGEGWSMSLPDTMTVHGLAYDRKTGTLALIALSEAGMSIQGVNAKECSLYTLKYPSYSSIYNLRAGAGKLAFNSIESGKDEIHFYDLTRGEEYQVSRSRYGSFSPSTPAEDNRIFMTTYTLDGYRLSEQHIEPDSLTPLAYRRVPLSTVNPKRRKWNVINLDTIRLDTVFRPEVKTKRYRKGLHLFNVHSWAPFDFDPFRLIQESDLSVAYGVTAMSQNVLANTSGFLSYGYTQAMGHRFRGTLNYYGLAPKFELSFQYGGDQQLLYGLKPGDLRPSDLKRYFMVSLLTSLPMTLSSGQNIRTLTPYVEIEHLNARVYNGDSYERGLQRVVTALSYSDNQRLAIRDILPRWGYMVRASLVSAPFSKRFGHLGSLYGRVYLPGILPNHSLMVRGNVQMQDAAPGLFYYKELFPRGAQYNQASLEYAATSVDYQFPAWYPDGGINSLVYFTRIRLNLGFDYARMKQPHAPAGRQMKTITSYGAELSVDMRPVRIPVNQATVSVSVFKPSDKKNVVVGFSISLPF